MLNRLFIAVGVLVILTLVTAFLVPRLITWGDYRPRLEAMASGAFGTEVSIEGDIALTLLPQPELRMTDVKIGPADAPVVQIADVEAAFSLLDFLRDQYKVTRLTIDRPTVNISIAADGTLSQGLSIAAADAEPNVSVANAQVVGGAIHVADGRSGQVHNIENINGQLTLDAIRGPYSFEGQGLADGVPYAAHLGLGSLDAGGGPTLSVFVQSEGARTTLQTDGTLQAGAHYVGSLKYRQAPPAGKKGDSIDAGRGDFTLEGKLDASPDRVLLSDYTALPDENRPTTRLTGAAELMLGKQASFNAVISGGTVALPPRDATAELSDPPYELIRLLGELPLPPVPPIAGKVGLDLTELNLRGLAVRGLSLEAATDGKGWTVESLNAGLPGDTTVNLTGTLTAAGTHPAFAGTLKVESKQMDRLAALWRKPAAGDPLFDLPGTLSANVTLTTDQLVVSSGLLTIDTAVHPFSARIGIAGQRSLELSADLGTLSSDDSAALTALMPDVLGSGSFATTFPSGEIHLSAAHAALLDLEADGLVADASWEGGVVTFSKLAAEGLGGIGLNLTGTAFGTLAKPEISGSGSVRIAQDAPALGKLLDALGTPPAVTDSLRRLLPADLTFKLDAPSGKGGQALAIVGSTGETATKLSATLSAGIAHALDAPLSARIEVEAAHAGALTRQLGLGDSPVFSGAAPLRFTASVEGVPSNSYETHLLLADGHDQLSFAGNVVPGDFSSISGSGDIDVALSDPSALAEQLGLGGLYLPPIKGRAKLKFDGQGMLKLSEIDANGIRGSLGMTRSQAGTSFSGTLAAPAFDAHQLLPFLVGAPGTLAGSDSLWPDGPIDLGSAARASEGRIDVTAPAVSFNGEPLLRNVSFGFDWTAQDLRLRSLSGKLGDGSADLDVTLCCAGSALPDKQLTGRLALESVDLDAVVPPAVAAEIDGRLTATAKFDGAGATLAETVRSMTGTGSFTLDGFSVAHFDPSTFTGLAGLADILDADTDTLTADVEQKLRSGDFHARATLTGGITIAGGMVRNPNLSIEGENSRIFGSGSLDLSKMMIAGHYAMTPTGELEPSSPLDPNSAEAGVTISGPAWAPTANYDVAGLVEGMKIKASEAELAILEQRKAEADARAKAQAADEARRAAERKVEEAAIVAQQAAEAAAMAAADAAAAREAAEATAKTTEPAKPVTPVEPAPPPVSSSVPPPIDLGM